ncbi:cytochrome D1 domain-containing protein [Noviherbaspirillum sp.]|uniref:cytochrome D1 domain-containing protein n=1 Tax=Noviherbaspirillum sp. TaxID=1926288 RepID=UPI002B484BED|nr:cytochrome D1 domain-containing protein [Noviherbaspirillum sp.]HJV80872.1 cytochrome D1 domain-containing protein [Noviherbaspirillum sp.]
MSARSLMALAGAIALSLMTGCASPSLRGTGNLGVVIERATGSVQVVDTTKRVSIASVQGLGDLSHASLVYSRDGRYAYVFGRDGGLSKVDVLKGVIERRVVQAGNSIGGAISQDGTLLAAQNYAPGGVKVFNAETLELLADIPAAYGAQGQRAKVVGLADAPGNKFVWSLFEAGEIWVGDFSDPRAPRIEKFRNAGREPYDAMITPDGRYYIAGLFGEDGMTLLDLWHPEKGLRRVLEGYGKGEEKLPVYKMPHLRGWAVAGRYAYLPAIGRHEVLVLDMETWREAARIPVSGQPVFVMARPDGRQVWVNFAFPTNSHVEVIDVETRSVVKRLEPGKTVLHMEFTPRGESVWISARDDNRVVIYDTATFAKRSELPATAPSGIFFTTRAARTGL